MFKGGQSIEVIVDDSQRMNKTTGPGKRMQQRTSPQHRTVLKSEISRNHRLKENATGSTVKNEMSI